MIFQDPMSALNPCFTIEKQLAETIQVVNRGIPSERVKQKSIELLSQVGIPSPESRLKCYPHELSGGNGPTSDDSNGDCGKTTAPHCG